MKSHAPTSAKREDPALCPFCKCAMTIESNRDWHKLLGEHDDMCPYDSHEDTMAVPADADGMAWMLAAWNRRAAMQTAEPVASTVPRKVAVEALNVLLWVYRRLPHPYGRPAHVEQPIKELAAVLECDVAGLLDERVAAPDRAPSIESTAAAIPMASAAAPLAYVLDFVPEAPYGQAEEALTPDEFALYSAMSDISEERWFAGWMGGNEYELWSALQDGEIGDFNRDTLAYVAAMSVKTGKWIVWHNDADPSLSGPRALSLYDWMAIYDAKNDWRKLGAPSIDSAADAKDAARFRAAISHDDMAESLYAAVMSNSPDGDAIRRDFDAAIDAEISAIAALQPEGE